MTEFWIQNMPGIFNAVEAFYWALLGFFVLRKGVNSGNAHLKRLSTWLFAFGVTDLIEIFTGAWWDPPALLVAKVIIGLAGGWQLLQWLKERKSPRQMVKPPESND